MAGLAGFEPATTRLEGGCSIQLSYSPRFYLGESVLCKASLLNRDPKALQRSAYPNRAKDKGQ